MFALIWGLIGLLSSQGIPQIRDDNKLLSTVEQSGKQSSNKQHIATSDTTLGRFVFINRIFIIGNRITRDKIILRELSLKPGDIIYNRDLPEILENDRKKLVNTRLFNTVEIRTLELMDNKVDLLIDINERWYTFPAPIFELSDRNINEWWQNYNHDLRRVNYGLRLYQYNMRGRNETLRFTAQLGFQRVFNLSYRIPNFDKQQKHGLVLDLDFQETKNLAYRTLDHKLIFTKSEEILRSTRGVGLSYTYRNSFYDIHSLKVEHRLNQINDTVRLLNPIYYPGDKNSLEFTSIAYQYSHDHRDLAAYPLSGNYFVASIQQTGLFKKEGIGKTDGSLSYARFIDLKKGYYFSNFTFGYWSFPKDVPYAFFGALGYRKTFVRGYEVYVLEGPYHVLNKTTLKKRIFSRVYRLDGWPIIEQFRHLPLSIYFKIYADLGYVENYPDYTINSRLTNTLLSGVGAGFDVVGSYDAVLRFEYSFSRDGRGGFFFHVKKEF